VLKLPEGLGGTEAGIKVFEDVNWIGQRAATTVTRNCESACLLCSSQAEGKVFVSPDFST